MSSHNLVIPVMLWGSKPPTHCISSIMLSHSQKQIITGCNDGQLVVWELDKDWKQITCRCMMMGHTSAITCLSKASNKDDKPYIVSSAENGEMVVWDITDGRCIEKAKLNYVHSNVQPYQLTGHKDFKLICNGYYPEILVMDPVHLEVLFFISSKVTPDWISALCILRPIKREDDIVVAISSSGVVKVWTLGQNELKIAMETKEMFEDESKQIRCLNAQTLTHCAYNQRTVLIVCSKYWQVYDAGDFSLLCSESSRRGERWLGGQFLSMDRVIVWSDEGRGYLYKLPKNAVSNETMYRASVGNEATNEAPMLYNVLDTSHKRVMKCAPAMAYYLGTREKACKLLFCGDCCGRVCVWHVPEVQEQKLLLVRQESFEKAQVCLPKVTSSLEECWRSLDSPPPGILDQLMADNHTPAHVTATMFIPSHGRLVCGLQNGSVIIIPSTQTVITGLLEAQNHRASMPERKFLKGHRGRVTSLLYPFNDSTRYEPQHLVSGGTDFSVILWDIFVGAKLHEFSIHGGEITQLLTPPEGCNVRILSCVCSVASDHSVALISLKERKCITLASQHLFPVKEIKWRPMDDFLVVSCTDDTVYIWQMETGHLDRVVHGVTGREILKACDENNNSGEQLTKPMISITQAFRRRNLATFRNLASQRLQALQEESGEQGSVSLSARPLAYPMLIQGLKTNPKDVDSHVLFFDTEALIVQLLSDEYARNSPKELNRTAERDSNNEEQSHLSDVSHKIAGFIAKVKVKAENLGQELQAKTERRSSSPKPQARDSDTRPKSKPKRPKHITITESNQTMEVAQLLISCLHAWGLDPDLDKLCSTKLGLLRPKSPISFGLLSRGGHMSFLLPGWYRYLRLKVDKSKADLEAQGSSDMALFSAGYHWNISEAVTTEHLLSIISIANTVMSTSTASFLVGRSPVSLVRKRFNQKGVLVAEAYSGSENEDDEQSALVCHQAQIKQGWSLLAALHCVLLPEKVINDKYQSPRLEMLARRWQDRCLEIREASQALFLAELQRIGVEGRQQVIRDWASHLPHYVETGPGTLQPVTAGPGHSGSSSAQNVLDGLEEEEEDTADDDKLLHSNTYESRRQQATAIVMLGVLGAEFGQDVEKGTKAKQGTDGNTLIRKISNALTFLLLQPDSKQLPAFTAIRRAAIDLIGRGFLIWQPFMDVSAVLLGLLELCVDGNKLVPSMTFGLPLSPQADACKSARKALILIANAQPPAFITTLAKEVARYNAMAQNAQSQNTLLNTSVLVRAKPEILRVITELIQKQANDVADLMVEVMDIIVHCLDAGEIRSRGLIETYPPLSKFAKVSYCSHTRRICVGAKNGAIAFYELKHAKCQIISAHKKPVSAVSFAPDGKHVASYSYLENKFSFWHISTGNIFNIGQQHTKHVKSYNVDTKIQPVTNILKMVTIHWMDSRSARLMFFNGNELRFKV